MHEHKQRKIIFAGVEVCNKIKTKIAVDAKFSNGIFPFFGNEREIPHFNNSISQWMDGPKSESKRELLAGGQSQGSN